MKENGPISATQMQNIRQRVHIAIWKGGNKPKLPSDCPAHTQSYLDDFWREKSNALTPEIKEQNRVKNIVLSAVQQRGALTIDLSSFSSEAQGFGQQLFESEKAKISPWDYEARRAEYRIDQHLQTDANNKPHFKDIKDPSVLEYANHLWECLSKNVSNNDIKKLRMEITRAKKRVTTAISRGDKIPSFHGLSKDVVQFGKAYWIQKTSRSAPENDAPTSSTSLSIQSTILHQTSATLPRKRPSSSTNGDQGALPVHQESRKKSRLS